MAPKGRVSQPSPSSNPWFSVSKRANAEPGSRGLELYPVQSGTVWEVGGASTMEEDPVVAAAALVWPEEVEVGRDLAWLTAWLVGSRRRGVFVVLEGEPSPQEMGAMVRSALDRVVT